MATLSWPARAPKIIRQRSATCCGVPYEDSHFSSSARSAGSNLITRLVFGMSQIIATADKAVKLFKGHYTSFCLETTSWAVIDRPYSSGIRTVGAVYDRATSVRKSVETETI